MTGDPLSILHVLAPADVGGLETVVKDLASGHSHMGHSVEVAAVLTEKSCAFVEEARDSGLKLHVIIAPPRSVLPERREILALLARRHVDVVHSHGYRSDILDLRIARKAGVPTVTTFHGFSATDWKARTYEWLQLRSARLASAVVAVSSNIVTRAITSGIRPTTVHLIRNAVSQAKPRSTAYEARSQLQLREGFHIGWIGRLSPEKGPDVMLDAVALVADLPITISFIGDGPNRRELEERSSNHGLDRFVRFHGRVANAASLLPAFDLVVLSSRTEGTPIVILESMAACVPIVATTVGGIPDMLAPSEAFLVPPEDPRAIASAIRHAFEDPAASATRAALASKRLIADFDTETWLARYDSLYRSIQPTHDRPR